MRRRWIGGALALVGAGLLAWVLATADLEGAWAAASSLGWLGFATLLGIHLASFLVDVGAWAVVLGDGYMTRHWYWRLWKTRMLGEAINMTTPVAGFGGEPAKAVVLNRRYGVAYRAAIASMIALTTVTVLALIGFLGIGVVLLSGSAAMTWEFKTGAATAFGLLAAGVIGFFVVQRLSFASKIAAWGERHTGFAWLARAGAHVAEMDGRLLSFYVSRPGRFGATLGLAFVAFVIGTVEVYAALALMGEPVSWSEAWIIESVTQLVRAAAFMIPGALGAQDGALLLVAGAVTGRLDIGVALALLRRARELVWICWGGVIGLAELRHTRRPPGPGG